MAIKQIRISNLRLIDTMEFEPADGLNLIWGANGSGKTTILEAIYLLGRGKSFRKADRNQLVKYGNQQLTLFIRSTNNNNSHTLGLTKGQGTTQARLDGQKITRMSDLARAVPLTVITPNSHEILERGPNYRRRFMDWGVFHVEPDFRATFERFARCLKQRNASLRLKNGHNANWDRNLIETGLAVNSYRETYFKSFSNRLKQLADELLDINLLQVDWVRGWNVNSTLEQHLEQMRQGDLHAGYTRYGPHRADLSIKIDGQKVEKVASRGQQKMLVVAMHLAQVAVAQELVGTEHIILLDDLTSELDKSNRKLLLGHLKLMGNQVFITGVDNIAEYATGFSRVFHVEQGAISPG